MHRCPRRSEYPQRTTEIHAPQEVACPGRRMPLAIRAFDNDISGGRYGLGLGTISCRRLDFTRGTQ
jgi:hypothetical protein